MNEFAERRISMHNDNMMPLSIEEFAAYLDGNLSLNDMNRVSSLAESNPVLQSFVENAQMVDETLKNYTDNEIALPAEIASMDFCIPLIGANENFSDVIEELQVAACMPEPLEDVIPFCEEDQVIIESTDIIQSNEPLICEKDEDSNSLSSSDDSFIESEEL